jgi:feruloyl esterase
MPGSERGWGFSLGSAPGKSGQFSNSTGFLKYIVYDDADWDYHTWDYKEFPAAQKKATGLLDATDPNIEPFFSHGGKLIMYHGWSDPIIPPSNTVNYYKGMLAASKHGKEDARLFMVPGMNHCGGGAGPYQFDARTALAKWVETKETPERIVASNAAANPVKRTRPLCAYPKVAHYTGTGSTDEEANFVCGMPKTNE